jgi:hypothetical protein
MKIRNIGQIITLMGLVTVGSAQSMQSMIVNGTKAAMRWTGTAIGVGYPLYDTPIALWNMHKIKSVNAKQDDLRDPSDIETKFLSQYITAKNRTVKIQKNGDAVDRAYCETDGNYIILPETYSSVTIENALESNDEDVLSQCAAIAQHKNRHAIKHHTEKLSALKVAVPMATTGLISGAIYKFFPYNKSASLGRHFLSMCKKIAGGTALVFYNTAVIRKARHDHEYSADQAVSEKYKPQYAKDLQAMDNRFNDDIKFIQQMAHIEKLLRNKNSSATSNMLAQLLLEKYLMHPPLEKRMKLLAQNESNLNFLERIERDSKR